MTWSARSFATDRRVVERRQCRPAGLGSLIRSHSSSAYAAVTLRRWKRSVNSQCRRRGATSAVSSTSFALIAARVSQKAVQVVACGASAAGQREHARRGPERRCPVQSRARRYAKSRAGCRRAPAGARRTEVGRESVRVRGRRPSGRCRCARSARLQRQDPIAEVESIVSATVVG